jgi:hypothetical protein
MAASKPFFYYCLYITVNPSNIIILTDFLNRIFSGEIAKIGGFCGGKIHTPAAFYHTDIYHVPALRKERRRYYAFSGEGGPHFLVPEGPNLDLRYSPNITCRGEAGVAQSPKCNTFSIEWPMCAT